MEINKLNRQEAFRYMGYKTGNIDEKIIALTDQCESELISVIKPRFVYKVFDIEHSDNGVVVNNTSLILKGKDISDHLKDCERCVLMCATVSIDVDNLIRKYEAQDMAKAVIADCLASAAIEQVCNEAEKEIKSAVGEYNFTWRFSPGYGDFPLEIQRDFVDVLDAQKRVGVNVSESLIMIPRKSVTAVIGVSEKEISKGRRGCVCCNMKDRCAYRKRGEHCGF